MSAPGRSPTPRSGPTTGPLRTAVNDTRNTFWCGPAVVSAITGKPNSVILELIKRRRARVARSFGGAPRQSVTGTTGRDLREVLEAFGYSMALEWSEYRDPETLASWARSRTPEERAATYILTLGNPKSRSAGHWIVVRGQMFCDNHTRRPVRIKSAPHRRRRVTECFLVERKAAA